MSAVAAAKLSRKDTSLELCKKCWVVTLNELGSKFKPRVKTTPTKSPSQNHFYACRDSRHYFQEFRKI